MPYDPNLIAEKIAGFEDEVSQEGRPTGQATGGRSFEGILATGISTFITQIAEQLGVYPYLIRGQSEDGKILKGELYVGLRNKSRLIIWNFPNLTVSKLNTASSEAVRHSWLARVYKVSLWCDSKMGSFVERGWIPTLSDGTPYHGAQYSNIYKGLEVKFDGAIAFVESNELKLKIFIEAKSAKSSNGNRIDGNAHERFSYQNLEYLELAVLYPSTQLLLLTNDAFVKYKNKYHTGFGVHAVRLSNAFGFYNFDMVSTKSQYVRLFNSWKSWIEEAS